MTVTTRTTTPPADGHPDVFDGIRQRWQAVHDCEAAELAARRAYRQARADTAEARAELDR